MELGPAAGRALAVMRSCDHASSLTAQRSRMQGWQSCSVMTATRPLPSACQTAPLADHLLPPACPTAPLAGKTVSSAGLHQMPGAFLASIDRSGKPLPAVTKDEVLREGDILWFAGGCIVGVGARAELGSMLATAVSCGVQPAGRRSRLLTCALTRASWLASGPAPAADVNSVRFIRNTPGLKPLVDDKVGRQGGRAAGRWVPAGMRVLVYGQHGSAV